MSEREGDRDEVADAIRARQSLENDIDPFAEQVGGPGFTSGERLGPLGDLEESDADEALDDDDVENSGDH